jgi:formate hydrogenlyase transcriptional activator
LRERREDIRLLIEHFVQKNAKQMNKRITSIPRRTMDRMMQWDWPGNIRELENFVERSVILSRGSTLEAPVSELEVASDGTLVFTLEDVEREHILRVLRKSGGRLAGVNGAAARLGLARTTLQSKLKHLGIDHRQFRS